MTAGDGLSLTLPLAAEGEVDGRRARSAATRAAVIAAVIALQKKGHAVLTAAEVAQHAGVSARSIFLHFPSKDSLAEAVFEELARQRVPAQREYAAGLAAAPDLPLDERIRRFVAYRSVVLEHGAPHRRAANAQGGAAPSARVSKLRAGVRALYRDEVRQTFAAELEACGAAEAKDVLAALVLVSDGDAWHGMRVTQGLPLAKAGELMAMLLRRILAPARVVAAPRRPRAATSGRRVPERSS